MHPYTFLLLAPLVVGCATGKDDTAPDTDADADTDSDVDTDADVDDTGPTDDDGDGWTVVEGDCDDADPGAHPGADEICGDGIDQDCDGSDRPCQWTGVFALGTYGRRIVGEEPHDEAGGAVRGVGDVNGDGKADLLIGSSNNGEGAEEAGAAYLVYGPGSVYLALSHADAKFTGVNVDDGAGSSLAGAGDVDGDGHADLLVGAGSNDDGGAWAGAAYLVYGPPAGDMSLSSADGRLLGQPGDHASSALAGAGDVNDDGFDDLLVGATGNERGGEWSGAAYLVLGPLTGDLVLSSADATLIGEAGDMAGISLDGVGDVDGDGYDDVVVGAAVDGDGGIEAGAAFLVLGPLSGDRALSDAEAKLIGEEPGDRAGLSASGAGDVDGDGTPDLLVGAPEHDETGADAGAAYLVGGTVRGDLDLSAATARFLGEVAGDRAGWSVSSAGDVDGDGLADLLIGSPSQGWVAEGAGATYLVYGPVTGSLDLPDADAMFCGEGYREAAGTSVSGAGDADGDGHDDLLVGAPRGQIAGVDSGTTFLVLYAALEP